MSSSTRIAGVIAGAAFVVASPVMSTYALAAMPAPARVAVSSSPAAPPAPRPRVLPYDSFYTQLPRQQRSATVRATSTSLPYGGGAATRTR